MNRLLVAPLVLVALAACADSTGSGSGRTELSFATRPSGTQQVNASRPARDITVSLGGNTLVITRAQLVLEEVELEPVDVAECDNSGSGNNNDTDACQELEIGPILVDLPLTAGAQTELSVDIPTGNYREIEFELEIADDDDGPEAAFIAANPSFRNTTVRVEGTINGQPFVFTSNVEAEMELEFSPALVVGPGGGNVTVFVDVSSWFVSGGSVINPLTANLNAALRATVESNIRASFDAFDDDDHDGRRDRD